MFFLSVTQRTNLAMMPITCKLTIRTNKFVICEEHISNTNSGIASGSRYAEYPINTIIKISYDKYLFMKNREDFDKKYNASVKKPTNTISPPISK